MAGLAVVALTAGAGAALGGCGTTKPASEATLGDVVAHCNRARALDLSAEQQRDLVEYLKSL